MSPREVLRVREIRNPLHRSIIAPKTAKNRWFGSSPVRALSKEERKALEQGLHSSDTFVLRRCQILLASQRGERPPRIAENLRCGSQTVRNTIHAFNERGLEALKAGSSHPAQVHAAFDEQVEKVLKEILH